jgi:hypothetical protein
MSKDMLTGTDAGVGLIKDPLLKEIREFRDRYAKSWKYNIRSMVRDLRKRESRSGRKLASRKIHRIGT